MLNEIEILLEVAFSFGITLWSNHDGNKRISLVVLKVLNAAIANAENNKQLDIDNLIIKEAYVGKSLTMKRWRPRAKGRASTILKPFSRLTIILEEKVEEKKKITKKGK